MFTLELFRDNYYGGVGEVSFGGATKGQGADSLN